MLNLSKSNNNQRKRTINKKQMGHKLIRTDVALRKGTERSIKMKKILKKRV